MEKDLSDETKEGSAIINSEKKEQPVFVVILITAIILLFIMGVAVSISGGTSMNPAPSETVTSSNKNQNNSISSTSDQSVPNPTPISQQSYTPPPIYTPMTFSATAEAQRPSWDNGCMNGNMSMINYCNCTFDYMINNYGVIWLINENAYANFNGALSPEFRSAIKGANQYCSQWGN